MIKTMTINGRNITFDISVLALFIYKNTFGEDPMQTVIPKILEVSQHSNDPQKYFELLPHLEILNLMWASAKAHDETIGDNMNFFKGIGMIGAEDIAEYITGFMETIYVKKNTKNQPHQKKHRYR